MMRLRGIGYGLAFAMSFWSLVYLTSCAAPSVSVSGCLADKGLKPVMLDKRDVLTDDTARQIDVLDNQLVAGCK